MGDAWGGRPEPDLDQVREEFRGQGWACWPVPGGYHARKVGRAGVSPPDGGLASAHGSTPGELRASILQALARTGEGSESR
jgi:hypothetical protein